MFLIHSTNVRLLSDMSQNIVLIFLKIFYKIYSGIIPDFFSNNLIEIITIIDPVFWQEIAAALISMRLYGLHRSEPQTASSDKKNSTRTSQPRCYTYMKIQKVLISHIKEIFSSLIIIIILCIELILCIVVKVSVELNPFFSIGHTLFDKLIICPRK